MSLPSAPPADIADALVYYVVDTPEGSVGVLDGFERDERGRPATLIVSQGWFGRRRHLVPIEQLAEVDHARKRIILAPGAAPIEPKGLLERLIDLGEGPSQERWSTGKRRPVLCEVAKEEHALAAVGVAAGLARGLGAPLILATPSRPLPGDPAAPSRAARLRDTEAEIATHTIDALILRVAAETDVSRIMAPESHTLAELASDVDACFLVVASRGEGSLVSASRGSVSRDLLHHAPCPVVVVPTADPAASDREGNPVVAVPTRADDQSPCPACGRVTRTTRRGACADCWQRKTPEGEAVFRPVEARPSSLLELVDAVPAWIVVAVSAAIVAGLLAGLVVTL